ncbi:MAG TPA: UPF0182 family protein [Candidatus Limnocylindria bacterium]|nr:UPF0182 family protein [Candidatus Limnocylindria bacterium]
MREGPRDWGNIDWSNFDLSTLGRGRRRQRPPSGAGVVVAVVVLLLFVLPLLVGPLIAFLTDLLWFRSLGFEDVFLRRYSAAFAAFAVFFLAFFLFAIPNLYLALRPQVPRVVIDAEAPRPASPLATTLRLLPFLLVPSFFFGLVGSSVWDELLRWQNAVPFGATDPLFGQDIGFYFFTLPILEFARGWLIAAVIVVALGALAIYATRGVVSVATAPLARGDLAVAGRTALALAVPARAHLSVLAGLFLLLVAAGYLLDRYELLFRDEGVLVGAGYTSVNARLFALGVLAAVAGIAALATFANAFARTLWLLGGAVAVWIVAGVVLGGVYPGIVETFVVRPDQLNKERPYLERHIAATRAAYGVADSEDSLVNVANEPPAAEARAELADTRSVRVFDWRPVLDVYQQLQALRQYYAFHDVDLDRYTFGGVERTVMLSARELDQTKLPREARTWVNQHLYYTHGFGAVLSEAGGVTPEGLPVMQVRDIPPQGEPRITQPRIYYGELTRDYVIVGTTQDEFDFAQEGRDATTRFSGGGGIAVGSLWDRLLFAARFGDLNLLISTQIGPDSRVLFDRRIAQRAQKVAPFLRYDQDPYLVIEDGRLYWIQDAYTTGDRYPYSEPVLRDVNYIRNSVKVVTDAYDGTMTFYVVDPNEPVIRTLRGIYPTLFSKTVEDMPAGLRAHLRYPEDLFDTQVSIIATYHMTNPDEFYNRGDAWKVANEIFEQGGRKEPIEPYYVTARLPGSPRKEFLLFVPMTPAGTDRDNMVGWIAGRANAPEYGKLTVLRFPKDRVIYGPLQIEARIEADATIRQQLTLLSSGAGANVSRGNLLVLPVGNSFVYIEPLFVQATQGRIPELKRVILATQDRVVMEDTFEKALARLFEAPVQPPPPTGGTQPTPSPSPTARPSPGATGAPADVAALVRQASEQYARAQEALRAGDFERYGREIKALEDTLARLRAATGQ